MNIFIYLFIPPWIPWIYLFIYLYPLEFHEYIYTPLNSNEFQIWSSYKSSWTINLYSFSLPRLYLKKKNSIIDFIIFRFIP